MKSTDLNVILLSSLIKFLDWFINLVPPKKESNYIPKNYQKTKWQALQDEF